MDENKLIDLALTNGYSDAAVMDVSELKVFPEYRKYCEMNYCGMYDRHPYCPSKVGTVDELIDKMKLFRKALVLQTTVINRQTGEFDFDWEAAKKDKKDHNSKTDVLMQQLEAEGIGETLRMSAGPWKNNSCMSAYCIDAQMMADACGMKCWAKDGFTRYFSLILFDTEEE